MSALYLRKKDTDQIYVRTPLLERLDGFETYTYPTEEKGKAAKKESNKLTKQESASAVVEWEKLGSRDDLAVFAKLQWGFVLDSTCTLQNMRGQLMAALQAKENNADPAGAIEAVAKTGAPGGG